MDEDKVVYRDGDRVRVLRGQVDYTDDPNMPLISVRRDDGRYLISKRDIVRIEQHNGSLGPERREVWSRKPETGNLSARSRDQEYRDVLIVAP